MSGERKYYPSSDLVNACYQSRLISESAGIGVSVFFDNLKLDLGPTTDLIKLERRCHARASSSTARLSRLSMVGN